MNPHVQIAIIGSGFSGLGMAIRLKQDGVEDFLIFERANEVGGVWRDNTYPGCACDIESPLYSYSFAPNPDWSRLYSGQAEIWKYLRACTDRFALGPHLRFGHELISARWDAELRRWELETSQGRYTSSILISGTGAFGEPAYPQLNGIERFQGRAFHSARWDDAFIPQGKRVAVIGTGASAIQFVPALQPQAASLILFQRTPAWVVPRMDRALNERERRWFKSFPFLQKLLRLKLYILHELFGFTLRQPLLIGFGASLALRHLKRSIADPGLRAKLTPRYKMGCKRVLISDDYYPALARDNVQVVTQAIREVREHSIVTQDGTEHAVDAIIYGTGFNVTGFEVAARIRGAGGVSLKEIWKGSPRAFLGTSVPGFPNLFFLLGPNTGLGHNSVVLMIESQIEHVLKAVSFIRNQKAGTLESRNERVDEFVGRIDGKSDNTVWLSGCQSWYIDATGRNSTLWPFSVGSFRRHVTPFRPRDYLVQR
jgi:cation diffusion facilitator CzcD-associated flavoprotein CzcO